MTSPVAKNLARVLIVIVAILGVIDFVLTLTTPLWIQSFSPYFQYYFYSGIKNPVTPSYIAFIMICGVLCFGILVAAFRILTRILKDDPFCMQNAKSLRNAGIISFAMTVMFVIKMFQWPSLLTIGCAGLFLLFGFFMLVISELFKQAAKIKEENELTI